MQVSCKFVHADPALQWKWMKMGHILSPQPAPLMRTHGRRRVFRRPRPSAGRVEPAPFIQPGGMVELALRELGAVLVRVLPADD